MRILPAALAMACVLALYAWAALAHGELDHEWIHEYERATKTSCCNRPAECHDHIKVEEVEGGYMLTVDEGLSRFVPHKEAKPTQDKRHRYWACYTVDIHSETGEPTLYLWCFFAPPGQI